MPLSAIFYFSNIGSQIYFYSFGLLCVIILPLILIVKLIKETTRAARWTARIVLCIVGLAALLFILTVLTIPYTSKIEITESEILVTSPLYSTHTDISEVDLTNVRIVKELNKELSIHQRTNGLSMAGLDVGWYTLFDDRNAFVFVTGNKNYLVIPTRDRVLILTPKNPDQVLKKIRAFVN
jgi:hypothetical protein